MKKTLIFGRILVAVFFFSFFGIQHTYAAITHELSLGSDTSDVIELQTYFATDAEIYPSGLVTGYFGPLTEAATKRFQVAEGIVSAGSPETTGYGRVGPQTMLRINALINSIAESPTEGDRAPLAENATLPEQQLASSGSIVRLTEAGAKERSAGRPIRLTIPRLDVNSYVEHVGLTPDGAMDISKRPGAVAWFELGPRPGEGGNAVIAGHYGWKDGKVAIFDNLHTLQKGDKLYVEDENGEILTFVVREKRWYPADADAVDVFTSPDGKAHLNLITCGGVWDEAKESYADRLVVFTDRNVED